MGKLTLVLLAIHVRHLKFLIVYLKVSDWIVDFHTPGGVDRDGWQYATDFPSQYHGKKQFTDYVRRRRWFRRCQLTTSGPWQELGNTKLVDVSLYVRLSPLSLGFSKLYESSDLYLKCFKFLIRRLGSPARTLLSMSGQLLQTVRLCSDEEFRNLAQWCDYFNILVLNIATYSIISEFS